MSLYILAKPSFSTKRWGKAMIYGFLLVMFIGFIQAETLKTGLDCRTTSPASGSCSDATILIQSTSNAVEGYFGFNISETGTSKISLKNFSFYVSDAGSPLITSFLICNATLYTNITYTNRLTAIPISSCYQFYSGTSFPVGWNTLPINADVTGNYTVKINMTTSGLNSNYFFIYATESGYFANTTYTSNSSVNFVYPTPNDGAFNNTNQTINATASSNGNYTLYFDTNVNPIGLVATRINNNYINWTMNISTEGAYYYKVRYQNGSTDVNSSIQSYTYDVSKPSLTLNSNSFLTVNISNASQVNLNLLNMTLTDNIMLYGFLVNISNNATGGQMLYELNTSLSGVSQNITRYYNFSNWTSAIYKAHIEVADGHTAEFIPEYDVQVKNPDVGVLSRLCGIEGCPLFGDRPILDTQDDIAAYGLDFVTDTGANVQILSTDAATPQTQKLIDRYNFEFSFNDDTTAPRTFRVVSDEEIHYYPQSKYKGHFIISKDGVNGNWIDFANDYGETPQVTKISDTEYEVYFDSLPPDVTFHSIGSLNVVQRDVLFQFYDVLTNNVSIIPLYIANDVQDIQGYANVSISDGTAPNVEYFWYQNGVITRSGNKTSGIIANQNILIDTFPGTSTSVGDNITFSARASYNGAYGTLKNSTTVKVYTASIDQCNNSYSVPTNYTAFNFTGKYENNQSLVNLTLSGTLTYNVVNSTSQTTIYPSGTNFDGLKFCAYPNTTLFSVAYNFVYNIPGSVITRQRQDNNVITSQSMQTIPLYVLVSDSAALARFRVVDAFSNPISGVVVNAYRTISGVSYLVQTATTDSSGLAYLYLDTLVTYTLTTSKTGYSSSSNQVQPSATDVYTITLSSSSAAGSFSNWNGVSYKFLPDNAVLYTGTDYEYIFSLNSSYWNITACSSYLRKLDGTIITIIPTTFSTSSCLGDITFMYNSTSTYVHEANFTLNGLYSFTVGPTDLNFNQSLVSNYTLKTVIDDINNFSGSGFDYRTRFLIGLIIVIAITAMISFKFQSVYQNPEIIMLALCAITYIVSYIGFFDFANYTDLVFPSEATIGFAMSKYVIFFLVSLGTVIFIWRRNS